MAAGRGHPWSVTSGPRAESEFLVLARLVGGPAARRVSEGTTGAAVSLGSRAGLRVGGDSGFLCARDWLR